MTEENTNNGHSGFRSRFTSVVKRRKILAIGGSIGTTLLAGCTSRNPLADAGDDDSTSTDANFRLLISDMPADIGDFDRLDVTFDRARIFDGGSGSDDENGDDENGDDENGDDETEDTPIDEGEADETDEETDSENENEDENGEDEDENGEDEEENGSGEAPDDGVERRRGFYFLDLDDATVDLTQVVGDKAMPIFEGTLSEGTYEKIELHVSEVEGIVDGEQAEVKVPSEQLQITHPFEITAGGSVDFVFDINVVRRGRGNRYNLTPVISKSGVNGEDVEVEEVDGGSDDGDDDSEDDE